MAPDLDLSMPYYSDPVASMVPFVLLYGVLYVLLYCIVPHLAICFERASAWPALSALTRSAVMDLGDANGATGTWLRLLVDKRLKPVPVPVQRPGPVTGPVTAGPAGPAVPAMFEPPMSPATPPAETWLCSPAQHLIEGQAHRSKAA